MTDGPYPPPGSIVVCNRTGYRFRVVSNTGAKIVLREIHAGWVRITKPEACRG